MLKTLQSLYKNPIKHINATTPMDASKYRITFQIVTGTPRMLREAITSDTAPIGARRRARIFMIGEPIDFLRILGFCWPVKPFPISIAYHLLAVWAFLPLQLKHLIGCINCH
jgi:hypothetical protein